MSLDYPLQFGEYTLHSATEDNEFIKPREKQSVRGSICACESTEPMVKLSNRSFKDFSPFSFYIGMIPIEMISQTSMFSQSVPF